MAPAGGVGGPLRPSGASGSGGSGKSASGAGAGSGLGGHGAGPRGRGPSRRRAPRTLRLILAGLLLLVLLELVVLIWSFRTIGPWWSIGLLVLFGVLGAFLVRRESSRTWRALRSAVDTGNVPGREIADAVLVLVGGLLLVLPGFLSDLLGLLLILPFTRWVGRWVLQTVIGVRILGSTVGGAGAAPGGYGAAGGHGAAGWPPGAQGPGSAGGVGGAGRRPRGDDDVIEGEIISEDPPPQ